MDMELIFDKIKFGLPEGEGMRDRIANEVKEISDKNGAPALEVTLDASHGGYINKNYAFYKPEGQEKSHKSFFTPFPKPVLTEHDDSKDPIGRVADSKYMLLNNGGDETKPASKIRLTTLITESDAIQKVLDGRYMTVSISGRPKTRPVCSICNETAGMFGCKNDHIRGQKYEDKICHYIFDEIDYTEVSFVNKPADQSGEHAATVVGVRVVEAPTLDAEAQRMYSEAVQKLKGQPKQVADSEPKDVTCEGCGKTFDYSKVTEVSEGVAECPHCKVKVSKEGKKVADSEAESDDVCKECGDLEYSEAETAEIDAIAEAGEDADKTLTTKQRKAMKGSTFCGPNRSYPVPDCSHGANAKARATQQVKAGKLSASAAAKIKACANRKMKALGCGGSDGQTTGSDIVDALIELVNELRASYEFDLEAVRKAGKDATDANIAKVAELEENLAKVEKTRDTFSAGVAEAATTHENDLAQITDLSKRIKEEKAKNVLLLSLMLRKESFLNVLSGKKAEERFDSFKKKLQDFRDISLQDLTTREEELFTELTKQAILQSAADELDPVLAGKLRVQQNKNQRLKSWLRGR